MTPEHYFALAFLAITLSGHAMWHTAESFAQVFRAAAVGVIGLLGVVVLVAWLLV